MMKMKISYVETKLGKIAILTDTSGTKVFKIFLNIDDSKDLLKSDEVEFSDETLASMEIREYFDGKLKEFTIEPVLVGTNFQVSVWKETMRIPYGYVRTYSQIAKRIGNEKAARAVGNALHRNPVPIVIPCHRVIAKNGLGGFSAGREWKIWLLELEDAIVP